MQITVDPSERFKTEQQKAYTDKGLKRLLQKTTLNGNLSDALASSDKDFMEYTVQLNAIQANTNRDFVQKAVSQSDLLSGRPTIMKVKLNNYYIENGAVSGSRNNNQD